ncbi:MAG: methyltransferase domain-containing protein [Clostridia bacterium]|nr:methyltransferase domain-containing protein [Clostridia bacterium]
MDQELLNLLACPVCLGSLQITKDHKSCFCDGARRHSFDFSRSGYLNLTAGQKLEGDGKASVRARRAFLEAGYYQPLSNRINELLAELDAKKILDAGCGEGYYTNRAASKERCVLGIDLSKDGVDFAAKSAKVQGNCVGFSVASIFSLPVRDASFDTVLNLFAPCAEEEFSRALTQNGSLILVGAGERHLLGLKERLYETPYLNPGRADLPKKMPLLHKETLHYEITVSGNAQIQALFSMTPYYFRTSDSDKAKLDGLETLTTEVEFDIFIFRKG